jgi:hypothetical protein
MTLMYFSVNIYINNQPILYKVSGVAFRSIKKMKKVAKLPPNFFKLYKKLQFKKIKIKLDFLPLSIKNLLWLYPGVDTRAETGKGPRIISSF